MILQELAQIPTPDMFFWYSLSIVLSASLIWVVNRYVNRTDKMFQQLIDAVTELKVMIKVHESEIENLKEKVFGKKRTNG
jgi:hypothetical protein